MKEYDAYLFDADGTLIDTRELIYQSFVHMAREMEIPEPIRTSVDVTTGLPLQAQLRAIFGQQRPDEFYENATKAYVDHMMVSYREYLKPFPGVEEGLAMLADMGKKLAVVTSRKRHTLELFLEEVGIRRFFTVLVTPEDTEKHKPHPDPAILAMRSLEVEPSVTVFVGDSEFDLICGKSAGTAVTYVAWGKMDYRTWKVKPEYIAVQFSDLLPPNKV